MELLLLALLGGVLALDSVSVGQFMLSRGIVAGAIAGFFLGDPVVGILVGAFVDLFAIPIVPVGGRRFLESGPASVVAATIAVQGGDPGSWILGAAVGLVWAMAGGVTIGALRSWNSRLVPYPDTPGLTASHLTGIHLRTLSADFLRGGVLSGVGLLLWVPMVGGGWPAWPLDWTATLALAGLAAAVPMGMTLTVLGLGRRRTVYFAAGLLLGLLPLLVP